MKISTNKKQIEALLTRGVNEIIDRAHLEQSLLSGRKLRIKNGLDPTGPKIHLGRAFQFWKLKEFQKLGHKIVLIFGDFTAQIGDASDKLARRRPLSEKEIKENLKDYVRQIGKILDMNKVELHHNSEWLNKLSAKDLLSLSMKFSAQELIQRRNFKERWEQGKSIGLHELDYPLLQGYDSVIVKADVEIGGSDQLFNLKVGRDIQKMFGQKPQDIMTSKMLTGLDGRKMSTSWGNIITIVDSPDEMYGKVMSMKDELISEYFELCTQLPLKEIKEITAKLKKNKINPRDIKMKLAYEITKMYWGEKKAIEARKFFINVFQKKKTPTQIPEMKLANKDIIEILVQSKLAKSKSEARRLINQKGIKVDGKIIKSAEDIIKSNSIIQKGKRYFLKII